MAARLASAALLGVSAVHVAWGLGASWPFPDRQALADRAIGRDAVPPTAACLVAAAGFAGAAAIVGGRPRRLPILTRWGARATVGALTVRGLLGLAGRTDLVSRGSVSPAFRGRDRGVYSPICLALASLALPAARS